MKIKNIHPVERHAEKAVVALSLAVAAVVVLVYLAGSPNTIQLGRKAVGPEELEENLLDEAQQLKKAVTGGGEVDSKLKKIEPPTYAKTFDKRLDVGSGPTQRFVYNPGGKPNLPNVGDADQTYEPVHLPTDLPGVGSVATRADIGTVRTDAIRRPRDAQSSQILNVATYKPVDDFLKKGSSELRWVAVEGKMDMASVRKALKRAGENERPLPEAWWKRRFYAVDVVLQRQKRKPDGSWGTKEIVPPTPETISFRNLPKEVDRAQGAQILSWLKRNQSKVLRPDFPPLKGEQWRSPTGRSAGENLQTLRRLQNLRQTRDQLVKKREDLQKQLDRLSQQGGGGGRGAETPPEGQRRFSIGRPGGGAAEEGGPRSSRSGRRQPRQEEESRGRSRQKGLQKQLERLTTRLKKKQKELQEVRSKLLPDEAEGKATASRSSGQRTAGEQPRMESPAGREGTATASGARTSQPPTSRRGARSRPPQGPRRQEYQNPGARAGGSQPPRGPRAPQGVPRSGEPMSQPRQGQTATSGQRQQQEVVSPLVERDSVRVWANDATAEPGATYRYRLRVRVVNPLFQRQALPDEQREKYGKQFTVATQWSDWSESVTVEKKAYFFLVNGLKRSGQVVVEGWSFLDGAWRSTRTELRPGDPIGTRGKVTVDGKERTLDFRTGALLVDIDFNHTMLSEETGNPRQTVRMTYLDANGELKSRTKYADLNSRKREALQLSTTKLAFFEKHRSGGFKNPLKQSPTSRRTRPAGGSGQAPRSRRPSGQEGRRGQGTGPPPGMRRRREGMRRQPGATGQR